MAAEDGFADSVRSWQVELVRVGCALTGDRQLAADLVRIALRRSQGRLMSATIKDETEPPGGVIRPRGRCACLPVALGCWLVAVWSATAAGAEVSPAPPLGAARSPPSEFSLRVPANSEVQTY